MPNLSWFYITSKTEEIHIKILNRQKSQCLYFFNCHLLVYLSKNNQTKAFKEYNYKIDTLLTYTYTHTHTHIRRERETPVNFLFGEQHTNIFQNTKKCLTWWHTHAQIIPWAKVWVPFSVSTFIILSVWRISVWGRFTSCGCALRACCRHCWCLRAARFLMDLMDF